MLLTYFVNIHAIDPDHTVLYYMANGIDCSLTHTQGEMSGNGAVLVKLSAHYLR